MGKTIFSALYNEGAEYLDLFIKNFLHYTDHEVVLIINLGFEIGVSCSYDYGPRVHFIRGSVRRFKYGASLLAGHMESFREAERVFPDFQWFVTMASNSLFFKAFDVQLALDALLDSKAQHPIANWDDLPDNWHWQKLIGFETAGQYLFKRLGTRGLWSGEIEGRLASRKDWALVSDITTEVAGYWNGSAAPLEEILPVTVVSAIGSGQTISICHVKWEPEHERIVRLEDLITPKNNIQYICMMKWFRRDPLALETLIVGTPVGQSLLHTMQETALTSQKADNIEWLLRAFLSNLEARNVWVPFQLSTEPGISQWGPPFEVFADQPALCNLNGGSQVEGEPYIFLSTPGLWLEISLDLVSPGRFFLQCNARAERKETIIPKTPVGYLFFPVPIARRLRLFGIVHGLTADNLIQEIMWKGDRSMLLPPLQSSIFGRNFVMDYVCHQNGKNGAIGFPLHDGLKLDLQMLFAQIVEDT